MLLCKKDSVGYAVDCNLILAYCDVILLTFVAHNWYYNWFHLLSHLYDVFGGNRV